MEQGCSSLFKHSDISTRGKFVFIIITTFALLQSVQPCFIHFHPLLSIFIHYYPFSFTFIHFHSLLSIFIHFYPFSSTIIHFNSLLSIFIHFYPFSGVLLGVPFYRVFQALLSESGSRVNASPLFTSPPRSPSTLSRILTFEFSSIGVFN